MRRVLYRLFAFVVGLALIGPLMLIKGGRGFFVPSAAWAGWSLTVYLCAVVASFALLVLVHWVLVERQGAGTKPAAEGLILRRLLTGFVALLLPFWLLGVVHGLVRDMVDGPVLERVQIAAAFLHYSEAHGRYVRRYATLKSDVVGRFRLPLDAAPTSLPEQGELVPVFGYRTWIGATYEEVDLNRPVR